MKHSNMQLSFLQSDNDKPLPLIVAEKYHFPLQTHTTSHDVFVYSIQDWIAGLTGEVSPKAVSSIWKQFKNQSGISDTTLKMPYIARDKKTYQRDFVSDETLYQFATYTRSMESRPQIREIKDFLAKAGVLADMIRQNPQEAEQAIGDTRRNAARESGKSESWITARELGIQARNQCTAAIVKANPNTNIGEMTNVTYKNVLGQDAAGLRQTLGLGARQNPRDSMSLVALSYLQVTEAGIALQLEGYADNDIVSTETVRNVVAIVSKATGRQAQEMATLIGVDLVTGQKLLK